MKALLMIDMPKNCYDCPFFESCQKVEELYKYERVESYYTKTREGRAANCPLKPMDLIVKEIERLLDEESNINY